LVSHVGATGRDVVGRLRTFSAGAQQANAATRAEISAPDPIGMEDPRQQMAEVPLVERAFAFIDLCGFTQFMAGHGEHAAIDALATFRALTREITTRRGVRAAKWLGDGAMLVGVEVGPTIAAATELIARYEGRTLAMRGGVAHGRVLLFDGDDYIGRPTNLAARLCQAARPNELLAWGYSPATLPAWVTVVGTRDVTLRGLGRLRGVQRLGLVPGVDLPTVGLPTSSE
jgi:class 3 adenylate cyclase